MKKSVCLLIAMILIFCLSACDNDKSAEDAGRFNADENNSISNAAVDKDNPDKTGTSAKTETSDKTETPDKTETSSSAESNVEKHSHKYTSTVVPAACASQGYTEYKCDCGSSYRNNYTPVTYEHDFAKTRKTVNGINYETAICTKCGEEAFSYGNADGSYSGGNNSVKYYVTGKAFTENAYEGDYHIVIYGQGPMPDFPYSECPRWYDYLTDTSKITIAEGITSIGSYAFNCPDGRKRVSFDMADSVKTIKTNAIDLNMKYITLGKGVEYIEYGVTGKDMTGIYFPKTLKYIGSLESTLDRDTVIFYEGTKEEFLNIKTRSYNQTETIKDLFDRYFSGNVYSPYCHVYLECSEIFDRTNYYDTMNEWK